MIKSTRMLLSLLACLAVSFGAFAQEEEESKNGKRKKKVTKTLSRKRP